MATSLCQQSLDLDHVESAGVFLRRVAKNADSAFRLERSKQLKELRVLLTRNRLGPRCAVSMRDSLQATIENLMEKKHVGRRACQVEVERDIVLQTDRRDRAETLPVLDTV